jgi:DNA-binding transcriptional LysR family regulator
MYNPNPDCPFLPGARIVRDRTARLDLMMPWSSRAPRCVLMAGGQFRIRDMEIIVALHEEGNMTQAAKRLGFTEPALSKQLKEIERRVQTPLFERGNGGVVATASGRAFVAHAMEIIQLCRRAIHDAHESKHNEPNRLRIGVSTFHPLSVIQLLHSVELRLYRNLSVEIVSAYSLDLIATGSTART